MYKLILSQVLISSIYTCSHFEITSDNQSSRTVVELAADNTPIGLLKVTYGKQSLPNATNTIIGNLRKNSKYITQLSAFTSFSPEHNINNLHVL